MESKEFTAEWFEASSKAWLINKRQIKPGVYTYKCIYQHSNTRFCNRDVYKTEHLCRQHLAIEKINKE